MCALDSQVSVEHEKCKNQNIKEADLNADGIQMDQARCKYLF